METRTFTSPIVGIVLKIQEGQFGDIITVKLDNQRVESRGFFMGQRGVPLFKEKDKVIATLKWNDLSKCFYIIKLDIA